MYFHFRSNYQTFTVLKPNYFYSLSRHAYEINPWLYHKPSTDAAIGNNVKGRFPTLKANLYLISWHLSFLFLSLSSDYRSLCLLLAEVQVSPSHGQLSASWLQRLWTVFAILLEPLIGALSLPIACFFVYLDIPFSDKAHRLSALLAYKRSYMPTMTMFALNSTASVSLWASFIETSCHLHFCMQCCWPKRAQWKPRLLSYC